MFVGYACDAFAAEIQSNDTTPDEYYLHDQSFPHSARWLRISGLVTQRTHALRCRYNAPLLLILCDCQRNGRRSAVVTKKHFRKECKAQTTHGLGSTYVLHVVPVIWCRHISSSSHEQNREILVACFGRYVQRVKETILLLASVEVAALGL